MWPIVEGPEFPIFFNSAPVNVVVTITFQANANGPTTTTGGPVYNSPPGGGGGSVQQTIGIFPNQTVTVTFDVEANGGFVWYGTQGKGVSQYVTFELENLLWGRG